jgi:hypothetical protein
MLPVLPTTAQPAARRRAALLPVAALALAAAGCAPAGWAGGGEGPGGDQLRAAVRLLLERAEVRLDVSRGGESREVRVRLDEPTAGE